MIEKKIYELILLLLGANEDIKENIVIDHFKDFEKEKVSSIFKNIFYFDYIKEHLENINNREIILHDHENIQVENEIGPISKRLCGISPEVFKYSLEVLAHKNNIAWNYSEPYPSFFTTIGDHKFRATLVHPCTGGEAQAKLFLRSIKKNIFSLTDFNISREGIDEIQKRVKNGANLIICGKAGSGKTSLLTSLINILPKEDHVVVLEDTREIPKFSINSSHLLGEEGVSKKSLKDYYALSLRLRPDRIILGEMRSVEIIPFVLSLNTGHRGVMSTIHSDNAPDSLSKMALLFNLFSNNPGFSFETSLKIICKNIDMVIYMENRTVKEVIKVIGANMGRPLYEKRCW